MGKTTKWTQEKFIDECKKVHNDRYDYSETNYIGSNKKITIRCKKHGNFEQRSSSHLSGVGCPKCARFESRTDVSDFILKSNTIHNNKYDYSRVIYINSHTKIKIICKEHGIFEQVPYQHIRGCGCPNCNKFKKLDTKEFIDRSNEIHNNKFDYSLVNYINNRKKIIIICPEHGKFEQTPGDHLRGIGCSKCSMRKKKTNDDFILKSNEIHNFFYNYSKVEYKSAHKKVIIICKIHGEFKQTPNSHFKGVGCPYCKKSKGETKILNFLKEKNIKFEPQKTFENCKYKQLLSFDFYLPDFNTCIEYDGEQHFSRYRFEKDNTKFEIRKKRDQIKTNFCIENDIKLIRIKYTEIVEEKLKWLIGLK